MHSYVTYRDLDTNDSEDYKFECGKTHKFSWVGSSSSSSLVKHNKDGKFEIKLADDCSSITEDSSLKKSMSQSLRVNGFVAGVLMIAANI